MINRLTNMHRTPTKPLIILQISDCKKKMWVRFHLGVNSVFATEWISSVYLLRKKVKFNLLKREKYFGFFLIKCKFELKLLQTFFVAILNAIPGYICNIHIGQINFWVLSLESSEYMWLCWKVLYIYMYVHTQ